MKNTLGSRYCIWCGKTTAQLVDGLTKDHVFPRFLGGTRNLIVPACRGCQQIIRKAEDEISHQSPFALHRVNKGPSPSKKKDPQSGSIHARYTLVKDSHGVYNEVVIRVKQDPIILPLIEIDLTTGQVNRRGPKPEEVSRLVQAIRNWVKAPPDTAGLIGELPIELLSESDAAIVADPDFRPRIFLNLKGQLKIRARNGEEAVQLIRTVVALGERGALSDFSRWQTFQIEAGTPHHCRIEWDHHAMLRVAAKITYAIIHLQAPCARLTSKSLDRLRRFVMGDHDGEPLPIQQVTVEEEALTEWPDEHIVLINSSHDQLQVIVVLYGTCFVTNLGDELLPLFVKPVAAVSRMDGTHTTFVEDAVSRNIAQRVKRFLKEIAPA